MTKTAERNGVLIYIAPRARVFRILGDVAIHEKCGEDFWKDVAAAMEESFRKGELTEGVVPGRREGRRGSREALSARCEGQERASRHDRRGLIPGVAAASHPVGDRAPLPAAAATSPLSP